VTQQDAPLPPRNKKKKKKPAIYGSKKLFAYLSKLAIAMKARFLKTYSPFTRSGVRHAISNILFNADRGCYEPQEQYSKQTQSPSLVLELQHSTFSDSPAPSLATTASDDYDITQLI
jgi:hypothetical protein